jgi:hypothetical protein
MAGKKNSKSAAAKSRVQEAKMVLDLLRRVLPKAAPDPHLAEVIYNAVEAELRLANQAVAFEAFCDRMTVPDLDAKTLEEVQTQLATAFGDSDVSLIPDEEKKTIAVDVALPDGTQLHTNIPVRPAGPEDAGEQEVVLKFVSCPVALPGDPELIWSLAKRENMSPDEAAIALAKVEEEFWASKAGLKLQKDRVEKTFAEFIARVPAGMLGEMGLKRHYKLPEPVKVLRGTPAVKR